ncbi:uncharacterized protein CHSO_2368 [Chryseobacterium sp. StRB126]|uniref:hypothetical protein n=1 Tax=Chryseobacterium sp. StRB126 TaxID=878220 RepID=UPI0004E98596|nr:hypothetical protein [Chryseobacterium sp. StRB126]BAP31405.1 uncharacterized protein CHSO_2368 [Chryseobacterium sp. StRB126]
MQNYIDIETIPNCKIEEGKFEWGEPYQDYTPVFILKRFSSSKLENSIIIFGENNCKQQLLSLYNVIINHEELERIENYTEEELSRKALLELINFYINKNENLLAPWDKYTIGLMEYDYIEYIEKQLKDCFCYVKI